MYRILFVTSLAGLIAATACAPPATTKVVPKQVEPTVPPPRVAYERTIDRLIPGLAAEDIAARRQPVHELEQLCLSVGDPRLDGQRQLLCTVLCERLDTSTPPPARVWLLRQLERIGGAESVPTLAGLLDDDDAQIRELARRALQSNPAKEAEEALLTALEKADATPMRVALINAMGARKNLARSTLTYLRRFVVQGTDTEALAVIAALGHDADDDSAFYLYTLWRDDPNLVRSMLGGHGESHVDLRPAVADALLRCIDPLLAQGRTERVQEICTALFEKASAVQIKQGALHGLTRSRGTDAADLLLRVIMDDESPRDLRATATGLIADLPGMPVSTAIAQQLPDASPAAQVWLLRALAQRQPELGRPLSTRLLSSEDESVAAAAARALEKLGNSTSVVPLAQAAARHTGKAQSAARHALARLNGPRIDETIVTAVTTAPPPVRIELIHTLAARRCRHAVPMLYVETRQPDEAVRVAALEALGQLANPEDAPALVDLYLRAEASAVRAAAADAVVASCSRAPDPAQRAKPLQAAWKRAKPADRVALIELLGRLSGDLALDMLRAARQSSETEVATAAIRELAQWPTSEIMDDLYDSAANSPHELQRILALQGFIRCISLPPPRSAVDQLTLYQQAIDVSERPEERRQILAGLAGIPELAALQLARHLRQQPGLRAEADAAVLQIASKLGSQFPEQAETAILAVREQAADDATRAAAAEALEKVRTTRGYITTWLIAGPYTQPDADWQTLHNTAFRPERPDEPAEWRDLPITNPTEPWLFDLQALDPQPNRCVYVRAYVWTPDRRPAQLRVGSDDSIKVWCNQRLVHDHAAVRGHTPFEDQVAVQLQKGWNRLLLKVTQAAGGWGFSCAIANADGDPPNDLIVRVTPPNIQ